MFSPMNLPTVNQNIKNVAKTPSTDDVNNVSNVSKAHSPKNTNHSNTDIPVSNLLILTHANLHKKKECSYDGTQFLKHFHINDEGVVLGLEGFSPDYHYNKGLHDSSVTVKNA